MNSIISSIVSSWIGDPPTLTVIVFKDKIIGITSDFHRKCKKQVKILYVCFIFVLFSDLALPFTPKMKSFCVWEKAWQSSPSCDTAQPVDRVTSSSIEHWWNQTQNKVVTFYTSTFTFQWVRPSSFWHSWIQFILSCCLIVFFYPALQTDSFSGFINPGNYKISFQHNCF